MVQQRRNALKYRRIGSRNARASKRKKSQCENRRRIQVKTWRRTAITRTLKSAATTRIGIPSLSGIPLYRKNGQENAIGALEILKAMYEHEMLHTGNWNFVEQEYFYNGRIVEGVFMPREDESPIEFLSVVMRCFSKQFQVTTEVYAELQLISTVHFKPKAMLVYTDAAYFNLRPLYEAVGHLHPRAVQSLMLYFSNDIINIFDPIEAARHIAGWHNTRDNLIEEKIFELANDQGVKFFQIDREMAAEIVDREIEYEGALTLEYLTESGCPQSIWEETNAKPLAFTTLRNIAKKSLEPKKVLALVNALEALQKENWVVNDRQDYWDEEGEIPFGAVFGWRQAQAGHCAIEEMWTEHLEIANNDSGMRSFWVSKLYKDNKFDLACFANFMRKAPQIVAALSNALTALRDFS